MTQSRRYKIMQSLQETLQEDIGRVDIGLEFWDNINTYPYSAIILRSEGRSEIGSVAESGSRGIYVAEHEIRHLHLTVTSYLCDNTDPLGVGDDHLLLVGLAVDRFFDIHKHEHCIHSASITYQDTTEDFQHPFVICTTDIEISYEFKYEPYNEVNNDSNSNNSNST